MAQAEAKVKVKQDSTAILAAIDNGFGGLKIMSNVFPTPTVIPSAVVSGAKPTASKLFGLSSIESESLIVTTADGTFFVGEQAMHIPTDGSKRTQVRDRASDVSSRVLFQTGIALCAPHEDGDYDVFVITGLPNDDYDLSIKTRLEDFLNQSFTVQFHLSETRTITKNINIKGVDILRQPEGTVTYNQFKFDPEHFLVPSQNARTMLGVIDFGHFTTDYALFQEGVIIENETMNGSTVGVTEVYNKLRRKLIMKFDSEGYEYRASDQDLDNAIRSGNIHYMGRDFDVTGEIRECAAIVAKTIAKAVLDAWGNETNRLELIIISGGGSHVFSEYIKAEFETRKKQGFQTIDIPQFSNVLGFYMYGCISQSERLDAKTIFSNYIEPVFFENI